MATEALAISDIDAYYGDSHVLHGVSFSLQPGRLLGLLGRNGAGKTTCMSTIMGFLKPRRGSISLYGEAVGGLPPDVIARKGHLPGPAGTAHVPHAYGAREPDGGGAGAEKGQRRRLVDRSAYSRRFPGSRSATPRSPARSPAASSRCSRSGARSWATRACC